MKFGFLIFYGESVEEFQVELKSNKNNRYFTWNSVF